MKYKKLIYMTSALAATHFSIDATAQLSVDLSYSYTNNQEFSENDLQNFLNQDLYTLALAGSSEAFTLAQNQVQAINFYMNFPESALFQNLPTNKIQALNLLISLHERELNPDTLQKYRIFQLQKAGIYPSAIEELQTIIFQIGNKSPLTPEQMNFLKTVIIPKIDENHPELCAQFFFNPLATYMTDNPNQFSEQERKQIANSAFAFIGKNSEDRSVINNLANQRADRSTLQAPEVLALNKVMLLGPLNLLGVCNPQKLIILQEVITMHPNAFDSRKASLFSNAVSREPIVLQFKRNNNNNFNPRLNQPKNADPIKPQPKISQPPQINRPIK